ncbi:MAG: hypothetical protein JNK15_16795, partial [Planctomycetes bacterium]|nr:hypothetical protein [Planctomycetota bacterium]
DDADAGIRATPATGSATTWPGATVRPEYDSFAQTLDVRGHDVVRQQAYAMKNLGPEKPGVGVQVTQRARGHGPLSFPFANQDSYAERFYVNFWAEPQSLANCVLFDHSDGDDNRNRISLQARDGNLVLEVLDEAGLDPNPGASKAGVPRTASEWSLPLAELGLPANTPVHVSASAYSSRPADLAFAVDGMTRGKPKFVTYLTAPLKVFDPSLANNQTLPGQGNGNERYVDLQVESTEGFPPVGVLRVGLELFEYSSINGSSFRCQWKDSLGGRAARQNGREHRPSIPVDANGEPTVDIDDPQFQGVNLDVFPEHKAGDMVELYGYSALLSDDSPMMLGSTKLTAAIGAFAVARGFIDNPRPIVVSPPQGTPFPVGTGLDENWTGELRLADPVSDTSPSANYPPADASAEIANAFSTSGGYALLIQAGFGFQAQLQPGQPTGLTVPVGGVEVIKYGSRDGTKLTGVLRAQKVPGNDSQIDK